MDLNKLGYIFNGKATFEIDGVTYKLVKSYEGCQLMSAEPMLTSLNTNTNVGQLTNNYTKATLSFEKFVDAINKGKVIISINTLDLNK